MSIIIILGASTGTDGAEGNDSFLSPTKFIPVCGKVTEVDAMALYRNSILSFETVIIIEFSQFVV